MKALVIYDSAYGNTEQIAKSIGSGIAADVKVLHVREADLSELESDGLLVIGSPTNGGRPTPAIQDFLNKLPEPAIKGVNVAAFDTRFSTRWVGIFGYAAGRIANSLKTKGGTLVLPPEGFFVKSTEGPMKERELERAARWSKGLVESRK